jgi:hypothetical protein
MLSETRYKVRPRLGPESHNEVITVEGFFVGYDTALGRNDLTHFVLEKRQSTPGQRRPLTLSLLQCAEPHECPQLAKPHEEMLAPID